MFQRRMLRWWPAFSLLCAATCAGYAASAAAPLADVIPSETYTHPNELVTVQGSRRMNLLCVGRGTPTVLFDAGAGFDMITWRRVLGTRTQGCALDPVDEAGKGVRLSIVVSGIGG